MRSARGWVALGASVMMTISGCGASAPPMESMSAATPAEAPAAPTLETRMGPAPERRTAFGRRAAPPAAAAHAAAPIDDAFVEDALRRAVGERMAEVVGCYYVHPGAAGARPLGVRFVVGANGAVSEVRVEDSAPDAPASAELCACVARVIETVQVTLPAGALPFEVRYPIRPVLAG